jgi:hypothetical protein
MDDKETHPSKQPISIDWIESDNRTEDNDEQVRKHLFPIYVTEFGIMRDNSEEHPAKQ